MPTTSITAIATTEIKLQPSLKAKLLTAIQLYLECGNKIRALKAGQAFQAKTIEDIQVDLGESSLDIDGYKSTIVAGTTKSLDKKKFVALGGRLDLLEAAMVEKPKKPYVRITAPGASEGEDE